MSIRPVLAVLVALNILVWEQLRVIHGQDHTQRLSAHQLALDAIPLAVTALPDAGGPSPLFSRRRKEQRS